MIAVCVGHSRPGDEGAVSTAGVSEHAWNSRIAGMLAFTLQGRGHDCMVVAAYEGASYGAAMKWLGQKLSVAGAEVAIELHFNASDNPAATGHEWLHWGGSNNGRILAKFLKARMELSYPRLASRGIKGLGPRDRGAEFVRYTPCPAVICEPFFGSNENDTFLLDCSKEVYVTVLADGLCDWIGGGK